MTFGVIGNGVIGNAVCRYLISLGYRVCVFDESEAAFGGIVSHHLFRMENMFEVLTIADIVIGCTGKDITLGIDIPSIIKKIKSLSVVPQKTKNFDPY
jgi:D-isomer specific 2-hydroxyacid dehydrogenase, NAD binding domain.